MYNSAGKFFNFRRKLFSGGACVRPSRRRPSASSSVERACVGAFGPSLALARGALFFFSFFSPVALASAIMRLEEIGDDRRGGEMNINKEWLSGTSSGKKRDRVGKRKEVRRPRDVKRPRDEKKRKEILRQKVQKREEEKSRGDERRMWGKSMPRVETRRVPDITEEGNFNVGRVE